MDESIINEAEVPPKDMILNCNVCQTTLTQLYARPESNKGLRTGSTISREEVTKLWLLQCGHLVCTDHLPGSGAPFHPGEDRPHTTCPICSTKGELDTKALYAIHGVDEGSYDNIIPPSFFEFPPSSLESSEPGMEGLRFQYLALIRFGSQMQRKVKEIEGEMNDLRSLKESDTENVKAVKARNVTLEQKMNELETKAQKLAQWEAREPAIKHYLSVLNMIIKESESMRLQLGALGQPTPTTNYAIHLDSDRQNASAAVMDTQRVVQMHQNEAGKWQTDKTASNSHSLPDVSHLEAKSGSAVGTPDILNSQKRKRVKSPTVSASFQSDEIGPRKILRIDKSIMPPPPLPSIGRRQATRDMMLPESPATTMRPDTGVATANLPEFKLKEVDELKARSFGRPPWYLRPGFNKKDADDHDPIRSYEHSSEVSARNGGNFLFSGMPRSAYEQQFNMLDHFSHVPSRQTNGTLGTTQKSFKPIPALDLLHRSTNITTRLGGGSNLPRPGTWTSSQNLFDRVQSQNLDNPYIRQSTHLGSHDAALSAPHVLSTSSQLADITLARSPNFVRMPHRTPRTGSTDLGSVSSPFFRGARQGSCNKPYTGPIDRVSQSMHIDRGGDIHDYHAQRHRLSSGHPEDVNRRLYTQTPSFLSYGLPKTSHADIYSKQTVYPPSNCANTATPNFRDNVRGLIPSRAPYSSSMLEPGGSATSYGIDPLADFGHKASSRRRKVKR